MTRLRIPFCFLLIVSSYILVRVFWDELPLAVNAGVGALPGDLLLLFRDAARRRRRAAGVHGTWDRNRNGKMKRNESLVGTSPLPLLTSITVTKRFG